MVIIVMVNLQEKLQSVHQALIEILELVKQKKTVSIVLKDHTASGELLTQHHVEMEHTVL